MAKQKYAHRGLREGMAEPFQSAEEAWFWFVRCQKARHDGARFHDTGMAERPCDPDDVYRVTKALIRAQTLRHQHLRVLIQFGFENRPPDARVRPEEWAARMWDEALDRMTTVLVAKGIVECPTYEGPAK